MRQRRFKTNNWLMLLASLPPTLFLVFSVSWPFGKDNATCWQVMVALYSGGGGDHALDLFGLVLFWLAVFAIPSIAIGWVTQAVIVVLISKLGIAKKDRQISSNSAD
jgi:hypothetical protein